MFAYMCVYIYARVCTQTYSSWLEGWMETVCSSRVKGQLMLYGKLLKYRIYNGSVRNQVFLFYFPVYIFMHKDILSLHTW